MNVNSIKSASMMDDHSIILKVCLLGSFKIIWHSLNSSYYPCRRDINILQFCRSHIHLPVWWIEISVIYGSDMVSDHKPHGNEHAEIFHLSGRYGESNWT